MHVFVEFNGHTDTEVQDERSILRLSTAQDARAQQPQANQLLREEDRGGPPFRGGHLESMNRLFMAILSFYGSFLGG